MSSTMRGDNPPMARTSREVLAHALQSLSYEVLPFKSTEQAVLEHVPPQIALTVTTTESKGIETTVSLACALSRHGYDAAPHLAARLIRDEHHLDDIVNRLSESGVDSVFVIGGDATEPTGTFADALSLLKALDARGHRFRSVGIGGYPEGHGSIGQDLIDTAVELKAPYATYIVSQLCFNAATTLSWSEQLRSRGIGLPIMVGMPGAVSRQRLIRISAGLGLGQSARFLSKQQSMFWRFFLPGGYKPGRLVGALAPHLGAPENTIRGFHLFTFNEIEKTEAWRRDRLSRLESG